MKKLFRPLTLDWKTGILPAARTAGALLIGNACITFLVGTSKPSIAWMMLGIGITIVFVCSIIRSEK